MTPLIQICVVLLTVSAIVIAFVVVRSTLRLERAATELKQSADKAVQAVQQSVSHIQGVTQRVDGLAASLGQAMPAIHHMVHQFEQVSDRAAQLSNAVLEEIESPVRNAVAVVRGVRTGTSSLITALTRRARARSNMNGGQS